MPELPDVEGFRRLLHDEALGQQICRVDVLDPGVVRGRSAARFARDLEGCVFAEPERRGKWLLARTDGPTLMAHFGMTGSLVMSAPDDDLDRLDRVVFHLPTRRLAYRDLRKLRGLWIAEDEDAVGDVTGPLGPDALGLTAKRLAERVAGRRGPLKAVLMNQEVVAGLGNMLSDEVLWRARIHPGCSAGDLADEERRALSPALQRVLRQASERGGIPRGKGWLSSQRGLPDPRCPRCHTALRTSRVGGRNAYWCPTCQRAGG